MKKSTRASLVPSRSILKQSNTNLEDNHTVTGVFNFTDSKRKIMNRRVSFAPEAFVRIFPGESKVDEELEKSPVKKPKKSVSLGSPQRSPSKLDSPASRTRSQNPTRLNLPTIADAARSPSRTPISMNRSPENTNEATSGPGTPAKSPVRKTSSGPRRGRQSQTPSPVRRSPRLMAKTATNEDSPSPVRPINNESNNDTRNDNTGANSDMEMDTNHSMTLDKIPSLGPPTNNLEKLKKNDDGFLISFDSPPAAPPRDNTSSIGSVFADKLRKISFTGLFGTKTNHEPPRSPLIPFRTIQNEQGEDNMQEEETMQLTEIFSSRSSNNSDDAPKDSSRQEETMEITVANPVATNEETMAFTVANLQKGNAEETMEFTVANPRKGAANEETMEFTVANPRSHEAEETMEFTNVAGRRRADTEETMELTVANLTPAEAEETMEFTVANPAKNGVDTEETMELTKYHSASNKEQADGETMELTSYQRNKSVVPPEHDDGETMEFTKLVSAVQKDDSGDGETMEFTKLVTTAQNESNTDGETMEFTKVTNSFREPANEVSDMDITTTYTRSPIRPENEEPQQVMSETDSHVDMEMTTGMKQISLEDNGKATSVQDGEGSDKLSQEAETPKTVYGKDATTPGPSSISNGHVLRPLTPIVEQEEEEEEEESMEMTNNGPTERVIDKSLKRPYSPQKHETTPHKRSRPSYPAPVRSLTPPQQLQPFKSEVVQRSPSQKLQSQLNMLTPRKITRQSPVKPIQPTFSTSIRPEAMVSYTPLKAVKASDPPIVPGTSSPSPLKAKSQLGNDDQFENISLQEFLKLISIEFMDGFLTSTRGHSSFGLTSEPTEDPTLLDYVLATQKIPMLELYDFSCREMRNNVRDTKELFTQLESETLEENPILFREYLEASADTKQIMNAQFKLIKSYARQQAKGVWYDWRSQLTNGVHEAMKRNLKDLQDDLSLLKTRKTHIEQAHAEVKDKYTKTRQKLEALRKRRDELKNCDRESIINSQTRLASQKKELSDVKMEHEVKVEDLRAKRAKIEELMQQKRFLQEKIQDAEKVRQANRQIETAELVAMTTRFDALAESFNWSKLAVTSETTFKFVLYGTLVVDIELKESRLTTKLIDRSKLDYCLSFFQKSLHKELDTLPSLHDRVMLLQRLWANATALNDELHLLQIKHMTTIASTEESLLVKIRLLTMNNEKITVSIKLQGSALAKYPNMDGTVSISFGYGCTNDEGLQKSVSEKFLSLLHSSGISGISSQCLDCIKVGI
ncbi:hypothetical protein TRVA0_016S02520 [Trichomonascus vanleenenianus]|uniref:kinetochore-microtubule binding complex subunit SPC105 n=1 Tax=Trichomonascus vanleenenianus TaxID=2268995 RepID=UPI003ECA175E